MRKIRKKKLSAENQIIKAYRLILGRTPNKEELSIAKKFLKAPNGHRDSFEVFIKTLFSLNEFIYLG